MLRPALAAVLLLWALYAGGGCAVCAHPDDCCYAAYGGTRPRCETGGRVGSVLSGDVVRQVEIIQAPSPGAESASTTWREKTQTRKLE